jgi:hypothetical protein
MESWGFQLLPFVSGIMEFRIMEIGEEELDYGEKYNAIISILITQFGRYQLCLSHSFVSHSINNISKYKQPNMILIPRSSQSVPSIAV